MYKKLTMLSGIVILLISVLFLLQNNSVVSIQWDSSETWLVFACSRFTLSNPTSHLYILQPDKPELQRISPERFIATSPSWSPDGQWISFIADEGLYKITPTGTNIQDITQFNSLHTLHTADWQPNGSMIALSVSNMTGSTLYLVDSVNGRRITLVQHDNLIQDVKWSSDGSKIAYTIRSVSPSNGVYIIDLETRTSTLILNYQQIIGAINWMYEDDMLLVTLHENQNPKLYQLDIATSELSIVDIEHFYDAATISLSGEWIAFIGSNQLTNTGAELFISKLDTNELHQLTNMLECNVTSPHWFDGN